MHYITQHALFTKHKHFCVVIRLYLVLSIVNASVSCVKCIVTSLEPDSPTHDGILRSLSLVYYWSVKNKQLHLIYFVDVTEISAEFKHWSEISSHCSTRSKIPNPTADRINVCVCVII